MAADDETNRIVGRLRAQLDRITDDHTRRTAAAWARGWDDVAPELTAAIADLQTAAVDGKLTRAKIVRARRLTNALDLIEQRLTVLFDQSAADVIGRLGEVVDSAGRITDQLISSQLPPGETVSGWDRVDAGQVDAIVQRTTEQITKVSFPLSAEATATMQRELVRGMLTGFNPRQVGARMLARTESLFNGGLSRAMTIARTEMLDAQRAGAQLAEKQQTDVLAGWIWTASLSERTCPACWSMHGSEHTLTEAGPIGHQNCRCARVPKTKSWRDLGFNIDEPPSLLPDAQAAFEQLSTSEQLTILGPARYAAWADGKFPMSKWSTVRHSDGWRDSVIPTRAPAAYRGTRRAPLEDRTLPWKFGKGSKQLGNLPKATLRAIQTVHDLPQMLNPVKILPFTGPPGSGGVFSRANLTIHLNTKGLTRPLTTAHEFGHYLDWQDFGGATTMASATSTAPEWVALRSAFARSPETTDLTLMLFNPATTAAQAKHIAYLLKTEEQFGRAYAQWIAVKTGRKSLLRDLERSRKYPGADGLRQWSDSNFAEISKALDNLFGSRLRS